MATRKPRAVPHEEAEEGHERWLVSYADMVTVLMILFIVMFAMSQVDADKFTALKEGLAEGFGADSPLVGSAALSETTDGSVAPIQPAISEAELETLAVSATSATPKEAVKAEAARLERIRRELDAALRREGLRSDVTLTYDERGLVVSLVSRHVTFGNDVATLSARGARVVDTVAPVLRVIADPLEVDGHTNQVDVQPAYYDTDWDLSAARAVTVLRRLNERGGVPAQRLSVSAYGKERPLLDPDRPGSQEVNKRVDIVVVSPVPAAAEGLAELHGEGEDVTDAAPREGAPR